MVNRFMETFMKGLGAGYGQFNCPDVGTSIFKQDLSRKCSAWKGFIPRLQWKSPCPKQKFGPKKIKGPKKFWV